jgi:hypothetical protein
MFNFLHSSNFENECNLEVDKLRLRTWIHIAQRGYFQFQQRPHSILEMQITQVLFCLAGTFRSVKNISKPPLHNHSYKYTYGGFSYFPK